jgi:hypothetical protein
MHTNCVDLITPKKRELMNLVTNTFPLLELSTSELIITDPEAVSARLLWLQACSQATQEEFATKLLRQEPTDPQSFQALHAVVLTMSNTIVTNWLALEISVAAKKVSARWAYKNQRFKRYGVAVERSRKSLSYNFKFPHCDTWEDAGEGEICRKLAEHGFPRARDKNRYAHINISTESVQVVEMALRPTKQKSNKKLKV